jgi:ribosomal protein S18 acetylase RimI-like enzyme
MVKSITIRQLSSELRDDYFRLFEGEAFSDNPGWASCYCYFPHGPHATEKWDERTGEQNRQAVGEMISAGTQRGYLAYIDEKVVGWCNAGLHSTFTILDQEEAGAPPTGSIVCFVVSPAYRRKGIARELLAAVLDGFRLDGIRVVEAFPRMKASGPAEHYHGPLELYLQAGFTLVGERNGIGLVRKELG